jgi:hypothetical protein
VVRALVASSACAVGASAIVGVLLGAYLHELDANAATPPSTVSSVPITVSTQVSTLFVTVTPSTTASSTTTTSAGDTESHPRSTTKEAPPTTTKNNPPTTTTTTQPGLPIPTTTTCHWLWC